MNRPVRDGASGMWAGNSTACAAAEVAQIFSAVFAQGEGPELINVISSQTGWLGLEEGILNAPLWQAEGNPPPASFFDAYAISGYFGGVFGLPKRGAWMTQWLRNSARAASQEASAQGLTGGPRPKPISPRTALIRPAKWRGKNCWTAA